MSRSSDPLIEPAVAGVRLIRRLGHGGQAVVYLGERIHDGARVAVKVAQDKPEAADAEMRLRREAEALRRIGAPYVPVLYDEQTLPGGAACLVLELVEAPTLDEWLEGRARPLEPAQALAVADAVLASLERVHTIGLVHRDIKPSNAFVLEATSGMVIKLFDFGVAKLSAAAGQGGTEHGTLLGTPYYMSPEQCLGQVDIDARADVYAMGVLLVELLTGRPPFVGSPAQISHAHISRRPPRLKVGGSSLEALVHRCLAKARDKRFHDAGELRVALRAIAPAVARDPQAVALPAVPMPSQAMASKQTEPPPTGASAASVRATRPRQLFGLIFFETDKAPSEIARLLATMGGELVHVADTRQVGAFSEAAGENPGRRALQVADSLIARCICRRVLVDLARVLVNVKADGQRRLVTPLLSRNDRYPDESLASGVYATPAAVELLLDVSAASVPGRADLLRIETSPETGGLTIVGQRGARDLVGREDVLESLLAGVRQSMENAEPTAVAVIADPGHGKSHLATVLIERLRSTFISAWLLELRAREPVDGDWDQTFREIQRRALDLPAEAPADRGRSLVEERVGVELAGEVWPAVAFSAGWLEPDAPELASLRAASGALRTAAVRATGEALRRRARDKPLLLILDDAQFADQATLDAVELAAMAEAKAPIWICCLGRPAFTDARPSFGERAARRQTFRLGPLAPDQASALCRKLLAPATDVPEAAVTKLVERTQGIPLLLVELVRGLKREGLIRRKDHGLAFHLATDELDKVPDLPLVQWLAARELEALPPEIAAYARLCALLGADLWAEEVEGVLAEIERRGAGDEFVLDVGFGIDRLLGQGFLLRRRDGRITLRHALIREAVCETIPEGLRGLIHQAATVYYERAESLGHERRLAQFAVHAARAGFKEASRDSYLRLAELARNRHAYLEAEALYSRALDQMVPGDRAHETGLCLRGRMRSRLGRHDDALKDFEQARQLVTARGAHAEEAEVLLDEAEAMDWLDLFRTAQERTAQAGALLAHGTTDMLEARWRMAVGRTLSRTGPYGESLRYLDDAVARAERLGDEGYETLVVSLLLAAVVASFVGDCTGAEQRFARCIALAQEHGDRAHLCSALNNRGMLRALQGDRNAMVADFEETVRLAREMGLATLEYSGYANLGEYLYLFDELPAAVAYVDQAMDVAARRLGLAARPAMPLLHARINLYKGKTSDVRKAIEQIRMVEAAAKAAGKVDSSLMPIEQAFLIMLDLATGSAVAEQWHDVEEKMRALSTGPEYIEVIEARALSALRSGNSREAIVHLERACTESARVPIMSTRLERALTQARAEQPR